MLSSTITDYGKVKTNEWLRERTVHLDIFLFCAHHSMMFYFRTDVLFTGGRGVSDFSV